MPNQHRQFSERMLIDSFRDFHSLFVSKESIQINKENVSAFGYLGWTLKNRFFIHAC
jgi:hypothetical protein